MTMEHDRIQEIRGLFRILEQTAEIANDSLLTQAHKDGEKRCISQFNKVLSQLTQINAVSDGLFDPLNEDATYSEISIACRHLAAYISEGLGVSADLKSMMTNILGNKFIENIGDELKDGKIGDLIRNSMPDFLSVTNLEEINKTFKVSPDSRLNIDTDLGSIDINATDSDVVNIIVQRTAEIKADRRATDLLKNFDVSFNQQDKELVINAKFKNHRPDWKIFVDRLDVRFHITVPQNKYDFKINTLVGNINTNNLIGSVQNRTSKGTLTYENITGPIFGHSGQGDVRITNCNSVVQVATIRGNIEINQNTGKINALTSAGNIRCTDVTGVITAETAGGTIKLNRCKGGAKVETSGGSIELENDEQVIAKTVGGSINANVLGQMKDSWTLETTGGDITVSLIEDIIANINAKSLGGEIISELNVKKLESDQQKDWHLVGVINEEGPILTIRSIGGDILIKKSSVDHET